MKSDQALPSADSSAQTGEDAGKTYRVGTLRYTRMTLTALFAWLLWGDFCFTLMETVVPTLMPLHLKELGAPSWLMSTIVTSIPAILNMTICPWVSYRSDRYRSRWGRRIPFILWTMPFLCICLVMMGWSEPLAAFLRTHVGFLEQAAPNTIAVALVAFFMIGFQFFNMFVGSVYWYLFNDVVPSSLLGRFAGLFRFVATGATSLYNYYVFQHANTHLKEIVTGAALLYFVGFGLMCLFVKEGKYPPVVDMEKDTQSCGKKEWIANIRNFMKESFTTRFYWYFYMVQTFGAVVGAIGTFNVFFHQEMGLSLKQIGHLGAVGAVVGLIAMYLASIYVDRWHPLRVTTYMAVFNAVSGFGGWIWVAVTLPVTMYFWINIGSTITYTFGSVLNGSCYLPLFMRLMPRSRYGQICSAAAMVRSFVMIFAGLLAGLFVDMMLYFFDGAGFAYRFIFIWIWIFNTCILIFLVLGYRQWHRLGGDHGYKPPAPWEPHGYEEIHDPTSSLPMSTRFLKMGLHLYTVNFILRIITIPVFLFLMWRYNMHRAVFWHATLIWPVMVVLMVIWIWQVRLVARDIRRVQSGLPPRVGVPHHGVLMVMSVESLFGVLINWAQTIWMLWWSLEYEVIIFGIAYLTGTAANSVILYCLCRMEREFPPPELSPARVQETPPVEVKVA